MGSVSNCKKSYFKCYLQYFLIRLSTLKTFHLILNLNLYEKKIIRYKEPSQPINNIRVNETLDISAFAHELRLFIHLDILT